MKLAIAPILALIVVLAACGNSNNSGNINGNWTATLTNTALHFTTSLSVNGDQSLKGDELQLLNVIPVL
jgi:hypothetical protein